MDTIIAFFLSLLEGPTGAILMILGYFAAIITASWLVLKSFLVGWKVGLASLFIPFAYLVLGFKYERLRRAAFFHLAAVVYTVGLFSLRALSRAFFDTPIG